ncbi:MAG: GEVED domain-containing protein, partial [Bacteroidales bacterium]
MKKQFLFTVMLAVVALFTGQSAFAEYCKTTETNTRNDRYLTSFTMGDGTNTVSVTGLQNNSTTSPCYFDKTASVLTTSAGATITPSVTWQGEWMHGYIWIDYNKNQVFEKDLETTGVPKANSELVSYTFLEVPARNSKGLIPTPANPKLISYQLPGKLSELPFNIPAGLAVGDYRARLVIEWASDNPCGTSGIGGNGGAMVDFTIRVEVPIASRTITLKANPSVGGTVTGGGTHAGAIRCTAVPNPGYIFVNWTNEAGGAEVSTSLTYTDNTEGDKTYVANFVQSYPIMSYYYTGDIKQTNRYLKTVTATQGANITTVFNATNESGLPRADFSGTFTEAGAIKTGALIDKTATPIVVDNGATSVSINFKAWTNNMTLGGAAKASELNWSQQAVFVDDAFTSAAGYTKIISIPANQAAGTYRMRVCYNDPQSKEAAWQNTLFTTLGSKTRNGKSYDFLIKIKAPAVVNYTVAANVTPATSGTVTINDSNSPQEIVSGSPAVFKATPATGYNFVKWTKSAADVSTANPYTIASVTEATTLTANFALKTYAVTAAAAPVAGGSVTINGGTATVNANHGSTVALTATAATGYNFVNWTVNGSEVSTSATF